MPARVPIPNIASPFAGSLLNAELWSEHHYERFLAEELPPLKARGIPIIVSVGYSAEELAVLGRAIDDSGVADAVEFSIHYVDKDASNLKKLARALKDNCSLPVFAKISPSVGELKPVVEALDATVDGYVAINSVGPALDFDVETTQALLGSTDGRGWLSGRAILPLGLHVVASLFQLTQKPVIGVGGIRTVTDVVKYMMAGAAAVQVCSLAIVKGQTVYGELAGQLAKWMDAREYKNLSELCGAFHRRGPRRLYALNEKPKLIPAWTAERCNLCDHCVKACVHQAIRFKDSIYHLDQSKCVSCGLCVTICPRGALAMTENE